MTDIPASPARNIDYSPLTSPVDRADVAAFRARMRAQKGWSAVNMGSVIAMVVVAFFGVFAIVSLFSTLVTVVLAIARGDAGSGVGEIAVPLVFSAVFVGVVILLARSAFGLGSWVKWYRLTGFAEHNGYEYSRTASDSVYPGAIFGMGSERTVTDLLQRAALGAVRRHPLELGNYSYVTGSGKSRTTHRWGFLAIGLDRAMPNMVLDSRANNGLFGGTNLPETFARDQALSLEGDFDKYFTLYCPKQYERDALYVFTPDLMALLIDEAAPFDVEIVDSWLFVYSAAPFDPLSPAIYRRLFGIADTVGAKALAQTDRYADDRVGDSRVGTVAPQGRRLRRGASALGVVAAAILVVVWFLPNVLQWFGK